MVFPVVNSVFQAKPPPFAVVVTGMVTLIDGECKGLTQGKIYPAETIKNPKWNKAALK